MEGEAQQNGTGEQQQQAEGFQPTVGEQLQAAEQRAEQVAPDPHAGNGDAGSTETPSTATENGDARITEKPSDDAGGAAASGDAEIAETVHEGAPKFAFKQRDNPTVVIVHFQSEAAADEFLDLCPTTGEDEASQLDPGAGDGSAGDVKELVRSSVLDSLAEVAHSVLDAEGHAFEVITGNDARGKVREMVATHLDDPVAPALRGGENLVRAVVHALVPIFGYRR